MRHCWNLFWNSWAVVSQMGDRASNLKNRPINIFYWKNLQHQNFDSYRHHKINCLIISTIPFCDNKKFKNKQNCHNCRMKYEEKYIGQNRLRTNALEEILYVWDYWGVYSEKRLTIRGQKSLSISIVNDK